jgi:glutamate synthase domain-containing protein 2
VPWLLFGAAGVGLAVLLLWRPLVGRLCDTLLRRLLTEPYERNLLEFFSATRRFGLQTALETSLRAAEGGSIQRPFGSVRTLPHFEGLQFSFAQLAELPASEESPVDFRTVIGPRAARPLVLDLPVLLAPMAYGLTLSAGAKVALAKGASRAGTATNTGEGPFLPAERAAAQHLIVQVNRGSWGKDPAIYRQADALELQVGTGARGGLGQVVPYAALDERLRRALELKPGEDAIIRSRVAGGESLEELRALVSELRALGGGVPVGLSLAAGKHLERDLELAVQAGADYVMVAGAQAGTGGGPPALADDFGLPTMYALSRAARFFAAQGLRGKVSLLVAGKLTTPAHFLKALALGADAVVIGTAALVALVHTQLLKALPWEPPTQLIWYRGRLAKRFDVEAGAGSLAKYLQACRAEMADGLRALGKTSHRELSRADLMALDPLTAESCGVELAYRPAHPGGTPGGQTRQPPRWFRPRRRPKPWQGD